ncbi:MAG: polyphosphate polymerase domain-containing protein [Bacteroidaceae bacterium]|nr:polyphosphate polymerase domain-containing protein [Bacteroidaceae bacterium]
MSEVKLMNRIDTKFVTTVQKLTQLLQMAKDAYWMQEIDGQRNLAYDTTYFDTKDYDMYSKHLHGHTGRQKLRFRTYVSSGLQFMEVKTKNNHNRTKKKRMEVTDMNINDSNKVQFLHDHLHYNVSDLQPALNNHFNRITLVNKAKTERLTIDTDLEFNNLQTGTMCNMENLAIIELKRDGLCYSPVLEMLRQLNIHPHGFSKYCMGSALSNDKLAINRFKPRLIDVRKILNNK